MPFCLLNLAPGMVEADVEGIGRVWIQVCGGEAFG